MSDTERYGKWEVIEFVDQGGQGRVYRVREASGSQGGKLQNRDLENAILTFSAIGIEESERQEAASRLAGEIRRISRESEAPLGALKVLLPIEEGAAEDEAAALERMKQELSVLRAVEHPALVKVLDSNLDERWFVMEFLEGGTLSKQLEKYKGRVLESFKALRPVVEAVAELHARNIVHRDIKPDNIFVAPDGRLVLADCGLAFRIENQDRLTLTFENVGTRDYQPAWSYGVRLADVQPTFDVFSLAKVLWAMVSGRPKFPLWYFERRGHDLRRMFPEEAAVQFVHEILKKCVVELESEATLQDASQLLVEVDTAIAALSRGCQLPGQNHKIRCRFCGIGTYKSVDSHSIMGPVHAEYERTYLVCGHCGHLEGFAWPRDKPPPAWDESS